MWTTSHPSLEQKFTGYHTDLDVSALNSQRSVRDASGGKQCTVGFPDPKFHAETFSCHLMDGSI